MSFLYLVGTPIGNLEDMSPRGIAALKEADFIAAEDTRVTMKLLNRFDIKKPLISYYEHNLRERGQYIVDRIASGEVCAVVSDAGMPCISDPGEDLVRLCAENGIEVRVVPGPSAAVSALAISGLKTARFCFEGFLSVTKKSRSERLNALKAEERTMIFYEAPHKLTTTLNDMAEAFGASRRLSICRELTKIHEEVLRVTFAEAIAYYAEKSPRGEYVLIVEGAEPLTEAEVGLDEVTAQGKARVAAGERASDVAKELAKAYGYTKAQIYPEII